ncbi:transmembrane protein [Achlya hypogyna]|uniref:Transmembrane protein n=1 Tax=Achlya hypogyna TaxID=1202772 RepID=A0A1V9ZKF9_ACHHY|nr:transmembrane protein [Achlya hypogyna]
MLRKLSKVQEEALGRLRINVGRRRPVATMAASRTRFWTSLGLAMRAALGALLSSAFLTHATAERGTWACFPDWYILGGVSFIAVSCVIACGHNVGATMCQMFQQKLGVALAFGFNALLFSNFQPRLFQTQDEVDASVADGTLLRITKSFSGEPYYVNNRDLFTVLPFTMAFNALVLVLPFASGTRKFAMVNNLFFALTVVSPNSYKDASKLKNASLALYQSPTIVQNLCIYMCLGFIGVLLSFLVIWVPYPIFAIRQLQELTLATPATVEELLHMMVDAYCFKKKGVEHMHILRVKLRRKLELATAQKDAMLALVDDAWWEQCLGLDVALGFKKTVTKPYVELFASVLNSLRAMSHALQLERDGRLHQPLIQALRQDVCAIETQALALLREIVGLVNDARVDLQLTRAKALESQLQSLLLRFHATQSELLSHMQPTTADVQANMPLHLFVFALQALCTAMIEFPDALRLKNHNTSTRVLHFLVRALKEFVDPAKYTAYRFQTAGRVWLALLLASLLSVYVFGYSATTATTIAYIMGNQIGGSFGISLFRAAGVVAGVIVPSIALFFICSYGGEHMAVVVVFRDAFLFFWVTVSMYVKWQGGLDAYAGLVSAFITVGVLLPDEVCPAPGSLTSYANVVQAMLAVLLIVGVELLLWPESAFILVRKNVQKHLRLCQTAFAALFEHNVRATGPMDATALAAVRAVVLAAAPAVLKEQEVLRKEAIFEPRLWHPPFSQPRYAKIMDACDQLLTNTVILFKLMLWSQHHSRPSPATPAALTTTERAIHDAFDSLHVLFGLQYWNADADQMALFAQVQEAFRHADKNGNGELDASDVRALLLHVFEQAGAVPGDALETYVRDFMDVVDPQRSGKVAFAEFTAALENGLLLEVEVLPRPKVVAPDVAVDASPFLTPRASDEALEEQEAGVRRAYDILNVEGCSLLETAETMRRDFAAWLLDGRRFQRLPMEELVLLHSLLSAVNGIAHDLAVLEEVAAHP